MKSIGQKRSAKEMLRRLPANYFKDLEDNEKLKSCCRKATDHSIEFFATDDKAEQPDVMIFYCQCGRRHIRIAAGRGEVSPAE